eukprot:Lithocolla_globosa_v1_NODE_3712_length_1600_cov_13.550162.p2 type:complete len:122 gc:universal NODE_3712_length_1600_cov_13.550162:329-694(+)
MSEYLLRIDLACSFPTATLPRAIADSCRTISCSSFNSKFLIRASMASWESICPKIKAISCLRTGEVWSLTKVSHSSSTAFKFLKVNMEIYLWKMSRLASSKIFLWEGISSLVASGTPRAGS